MTPAEVEEEAEENFGNTKNSRKKVSRTRPFNWAYGSGDHRWVGVWGGLVLGCVTGPVHFDCVLSPSAEFLPKTETNMEEMVNFYLWKLNKWTLTGGCPGVDPSSATRGVCVCPVIVCVLWRVIKYFCLPHYRKPPPGTKVWHQLEH